MKNLLIKKLQSMTEKMENQTAEKLVDLPLAELLVMRIDIARKQHNMKYASIGYQALEKLDKQVQAELQKRIEIMYPKPS